MNTLISLLLSINTIDPEKTFEGIYGNFQITQKDHIEVNLYRLALLLCGISYLTGMLQWLIVGPELAWIWLFPMAISLGLALNWIHIYLVPLHKILQFFWIIGCLGIILMLYKLEANQILPSLHSQRNWTIALGPLFASLTGIGFKEFFCFRRIEAIGLTLLLPIAILGYLIGLLNGGIVITLLIVSAILLVMLSIRKFSMPIEDDIGDKSVFEYLKNSTITNS